VDALVVADRNIDLQFCESFEATAKGRAVDIVRSTNR
jgi:hypothetical protein